LRPARLIKRVGESATGPLRDGASTPWRVAVALAEIDRVKTLRVTKSEDFRVPDDCGIVDHPTADGGCVSVAGSLWMPVISWRAIHPGMRAIGKNTAAFDGEASERIFEPLKPTPDLKAAGSARKSRRR